MAPRFVHYYGVCFTCGKPFDGPLEDVEKVRKRAKHHAESKRHEVTFETGYSNRFGKEV